MGRNLTGARKIFVTKNCDFSRSWREVEGWKSRGFGWERIFSRGEGQSFPRWKLIPLDNLSPLPLRAWERGSSVGGRNEGEERSVTLPRSFFSLEILEADREVCRIYEISGFRREGEERPVPAEEGGEGLTWSSHFLDRERASWGKGRHIPSN